MPEVEAVGEGDLEAGGEGAMAVKEGRARTSFVYLSVISLLWSSTGGVGSKRRETLSPGSLTHRAVARPLLHLHLTLLRSPLGRLHKYRCS